MIAPDEPSAPVSVATECAEEDAAKRPRLLSGARSFSLGSALGIAASVIRVLVAGRVLSSVEASIWIGLQVVLAYAANAHLGILFGTLRNVPVLLGAGDARGAREVEQTSFGAVMRLAAVACVATLLAARMYFDASRAASVLIALLVGVTLIRSYYVTEYKGRARHADLGFTTALGGLVSAASLPLILFFRVEGLIAGMTLQYAFETIHLAGRTAWPGLHITSPVLRAQLRFGSVALVTNVAATFLASVDRSVMLELCGHAETGLYYLGANAKTLVPMLVALPFAVITPRVFERHGRGESLLPTVELPTRATVLGLPPLLAAGACFVDAATATFFPNLVGGELATIVAMATCVHVVASGFAANVFVAFDRQKRSLVVLGASALVSLGGALAAGHLGLGIAGIAAGAGLGGLAYFVGLVVWAYELMGLPRAAAMRLIAISLAPSVLLFAIVLGGRHVLGSLGFGAWVSGAALLAVVVPVSVPCLKAGLHSLRTLRAMR